MSRLTGKPIEEIGERKIDILQATAKILNATIILKGAHTLIGYPDERVFINLSGNPGMATAGSGDVLTGAIAAMYGLGLGLNEAISTGVFIHGLAGDLARDHVGHEIAVSGEDIAKQLGLSQATISRLFNRAREEGIVRITVNTPNGLFVDHEKALMGRYGLRDAIVVDCHNSKDEEIIQRDISAAASYYVENAINNGEIIGISSWSATLLKLVDSPPLPGSELP